MPLAEELETYEVEILDGAAVKRVLSAATTSAVYTAAQQSADWGAPLAPGSYDIEFEGFESGRKAWDPVAACSVTIDGAGGLGLATCRAAYFAP